MEETPRQITMVHFLEFFLPRLTLKQFILAVYEAQPGADCPFFARGLSAFRKKGGLFGYEPNGPTYSGAMLYVYWGSGLTCNQYYIQYPCLPPCLQQGGCACETSQEERQKLEMTLAGGAEICLGDQSLF